jgi:hypothetical protein
VIIEIILPEIHIVNLDPQKNSQNRIEGRCNMPKRPKETWQIETRSKLEQMGIGYGELAERLGYEPGTVRQAMCRNYNDKIKSKICSYLGIKES